MSDIYDLIVNHFRDLKPADYLLLALLVVGLGALLFRWLRTMYREPLEAQQAATSAWRDVAEGYKQRIESLESQTGLLEQNVEQARQTADGLRARESELTMHLVIMVGLLAMSEAISRVRSMLIFYMGMQIHEDDPSSPHPIELFKELQGIEDRLRVVWVAAAREAVPPSHLSSETSKRFSELQPDEISAVADKINIYVAPRLEQGE